MLVKVELSLASRQLVNRVLSEMGSVKIDEARKAKEIRQRFELRASRREVNRMASERERQQRERRKTLETLGEKEEDNQISDRDFEDLPALGWDELAETGLHAFTIDDAYLNWLHDLVKSKDWAKAPIQDLTTGRMAEQTILLDPSLLDAIVDLDDALRAAAKVQSDHEPSEVDEEYPAGKEHPEKPVTRRGKRS